MSITFLVTLLALSTPSHADATPTDAQPADFHAPAPVLVQSDLPDPPDQAADPTFMEYPMGPLATFGAIYGGYLGATGAWLMGEATEASEDAHTTQGVLPGGFIGSSAGLGTGLLIGAFKPITADGYALLYTDTAAGFYYGDAIGRAFIPVGAPGDRERIRAAGMAGSMAGIATAIVTQGQAAPLRNQLNFTLATGVGWVTGHGIGNAAGWDRTADRSRYAAVEGISSAGLGGLALLSNRGVLEAPTPASGALMVGDGIWFGTWSPFLFADDPTPEQSLGGAQIGLGYAYAAGLATASFGQPSNKSVALQAAGLSAGSALGAGVPLSLSSTGPMRAFVAPMMATGVAGQILGGLVAPHYDLGTEDALLLTALESWTTWQAVGWGAYARSTNVQPSQAIGYTLTTAGAGTLATLALLPALDVTPEGTTMIVSGGGWGTWFGAWGSQIAGGDPNTTWIASLAAGDGALLATGAAEAMGWQPTWRQTALINGLGILGAAGGGLLGTVALYDPNNWTPISASVMAGSGAGLITGAVLGAAHPGGSGQTASKGLRTPATPSNGRLATAWKRVPFHASVQATPWSSEEGDPGLWLQLDLTEKRHR
ncbi:MAG: hypothetical protein GXP62_20335 [Oligoflexia bacterium]|nr:hypothetical protein [Oligoflexia bacterium]